MLGQSQVDKINNAIAGNYYTYLVGKLNGEVDNGPAQVDGPIREIIICYGKHIDSTQLTYGRSQYHQLGQGGGTEEKLTLGDGEVIVGAKVWYDKKINGIEFRIQPPGGNPYTSKVFGHESGTLTVAERDGAPLRRLTGRFGRSVYMLFFKFGYDARIENVAIDQATLEQKLTALTVDLRSISSSNIDNGGDEPITQVVSSGQGLDEELTVFWENTTSFVAGLKISADAGVIFTKAATEISFKLSFSAKAGESNTIKKRRFENLETKVTCPPKSSLNWQYKTYGAFLEAVPFTYDVVVCNPVDHRYIVGRYQLSGYVNGNVLASKYYFETSVGALGSRPNDTAA